MGKGETVKGGIIIDGKDLPRIAKFAETDIQLHKELTAVFAKFGLEGRLTRFEFQCGTVPRPIPKLRCYRSCTFGPDDRPICIWVCY